MNVRIMSREGTMVTAEAPVGTFKGHWHAPEQPGSGEYAVELDFSGVLELEMIVLSNENKPSIKMQGEKVRVCGRVEEIENGVLFLRVQTDLLMLPVSCEHSFLDFLNQDVAVTLPGLDLYPY